MNEKRFYEAQESGSLRSAPAALRNRQPIAEGLERWLPRHGLVLEIASGTGEHAVYFADRFPRLDWQPSDLDHDALASIAVRQADAGLPNLRPPILVDAAAADWPVDAADAVLSINMVHISPWASALGLIEGSARLLGDGAPLILYGPWLSDAVETVASNLVFDADLRRRDPQWGLRRVEDFERAAREKGLRLAETMFMPANNIMLLFRKAAAPR